MHYDPRHDKRPVQYDPFKSCTVPRPIGWLSTVSSNGINNLAPYSQWQNLTFDPPMVMFAANGYPDGRRKDTVINAEETGWFVWNMATWELREAVNRSAQAFSPEIDEFKEAGVTGVACIDAPGLRVAESPCHFECKYLSTQRLKGNSPVGNVDVVFAEVVRIHVNDDVLTSDGKIDIPKIKPIARLGYYDYCVVDNVFEMKIPGSSTAADGLEGKA
ncbi:MAG: flavin reductase (DIM6/NTAB) family NADH-FMN oxidoreductase RutF [Granulosicoccus sp.]|jgi:flavin reductase (DIM6/NTAB) family NADH-FMN oxidoreductase RutF